MPSVRTMCVTSDSTSTDVCTFVLCAIRPQGSLVLLTFQRGEQQITVHLERRMPDLEVYIFVCVCVCVCVTVVCVRAHAFTLFLCNPFLLLTSLLSGAFSSVQATEQVVAQAKESSGISFARTYSGTHIQRHMQPQYLLARE